jgi:CRP-like cAMP-binding protein
MTADQLARLALFAGVPHSELVLLLEHCSPVVFPRGSVVMRQGAPATHALLVVTGALEATAEADGQTVVLGAVRAGALIGESALLVLSEGRSATLVATHRVEALQITRDHLVELKGTRVLAALQMQMLTATAKRIRDTGAAMRELVRASSDGNGSDHRSAPNVMPPAWRTFLDRFGALA